MLQLHEVAAFADMETAAPAPIALVCSPVNFQISSSSEGSMAMGCRVWVSLERAEAGEVCFFVEMERDM